jgi:hypothetical protein
MIPRKVQFIALEEDSKDLIVSFALGDEQGYIESLILLRSLFYEELLNHDERGVKVSLESDVYAEKDRNMLIEIEINGSEIVIRSTFREYKLDISRIDKQEVQDMVKLLKKQNYDDNFTIHVT